MNKSFKIPQLVLTVMAAIGMFLPLISVRVSVLSESISFFKVNTDGKIIFGLIVVAAIMLFFKNEKNSVLGIVALLFITGAGVFFGVDMSKIADGMAYVKTLSGNTIHYGIGYYMTLVGLSISFVLGVIELISGNTKNNNEYEYVITPQMPNNLNNQYNIPTNTTLNQPDNILNNPTNTISNQSNEQVNNEVKLSDLVNGNSINANVETPNNEVNLEETINNFDNINNNNNQSL